MDCHSKLVLHSPRNNQPVQVVMHLPSQITLVFSGPCNMKLGGQDNDGLC